MVKHLFERIATEAKSLQAIQQFSKKHGKGRATFTAKDVQSAVALVLPGGACYYSYYVVRRVCIVVVVVVVVFSSSIGQYRLTPRPC
jgi:hypothetical protein